MQLERLRARKAVREARESGICENKFEDRSRELRVLASGVRPVAEIDVRELSARLRCFRNRHLVEGRMPVDKMLELLCLGLYHVSDVLEWELLDPDLLTLWDPRTWPWAEPVLELVGRTGELLLGRLFFASDVKSLEGERPKPRSLWCMARDSRFSGLPTRESGDPGAEFE